MEIELVHDFWNNEPIPNGINYRYLNYYLNSNPENSDYVKSTFNGRLETVWNGFGNLPHFRSVPISDIDISATDSMYLFRICLYGGGWNSFGCPYSLTEGRTFLEFISKKAIKYIKNVSNFYLCIDFSSEGVNDTIFLTNLYNDLDRYGIPFNKVIYITGDFNIESILQTWLKRINREDSKIHTIYNTWSFLTKQYDYIISNNFVKFKTVKSKKDFKRPYKFLMFNRRTREHRFYSILYFHYNDLIKDMLISYDLSIENNIKNYYPAALELFNIPKNSITPVYNDLVKNKQKMTIDINDINKAVGIGRNDSMEPFMNSYIHIISETSVFHSSGYLSEKTWKPIANLQPFIMMGSYRSLEVLKDMGFKTFSPFINESYDLIDSNEDRFIKVLEEIKRLSMIPIEELHKWYYSIQDILRHNQELFFSREAVNKYQLQTLHKILSIHGSKPPTTSKRKMRGI